MRQHGQVLGPQPRGKPKWTRRKQQSVQAAGAGRQLPKAGRHANTKAADDWHSGTCTLALCTAVCGCPHRVPQLVDVRLVHLKDGLVPHLRGTPAAAATTVQ